MIDKPVKIRYWCEVVQYGDFYEGEPIEIPRAEWNAMSAAERERVGQEAAIEHQNEIAPCGWEVIE
jgi:hypothetical protein